MDVVDVLDDAEQVSRVDAVGQRARVALAGEDRDRVDDGVAWIAGDRIAEVTLGIEQAETREGIVEDRANDGIDASFTRLSREFLLAHTSLQRSACGLAFLGRDALPLPLPLQELSGLQHRKRRRMLPSMNLSTRVVFAMLGTTAAGCNKPAAVTSPPADVRAAIPACHVATPEVVEDSTPLGRLRASWRAAVKREMRTYDDVMTGVRPAYEGFAWFQGKRHGPVAGLVREDKVDGVVVHQLQLDGPINTRITIAQRTPRQAGAFLIQVPAGLIECSNCVDLDAFSLPANMQFKDRSMAMLGMAPDGKQSRVPVSVRAELRRLTPDRIAPQTARTLFPMIAQPDGNAMIVRPYTDVWIPVDRPATADAGHASCEAVLLKPPVVRIDTECLATWNVEFESDTIATTCCTQPRYHGPPRSGHYPEDCVPVRSVQ